MWPHSFGFQVLDVPERSERARGMGVGADNRWKVLYVLDENTAEVYDLGPAPPREGAPVKRAANKRG
jgi:hypothetical protein